MSEQDQNTAAHALPFELPLTAHPDTRLDDGSDCWSLSSPNESIAEMMCPADIEQAAAEFIARAVNSYCQLVAACRAAYKRAASQCYCESLTSMQIEGVWFGIVLILLVAAIVVVAGIFQHRREEKILSRSGD